MNVPLPFIQSPVGLGTLIASVIHGIFGGVPCLPCLHRSDAINDVIRFVPLKKG